MYILGLDEIKFNLIECAQHVSQHDGGHTQTSQPIFLFFAMPMFYKNSFMTGKVIVYVPRAYYYIRYEIIRNL